MTYTLRMQFGVMCSARASFLGPFLSVRCFRISQAPLENFVFLIAQITVMTSDHNISALVFLLHGSEWDRAFLQECSTKQQGNGVWQCVAVKHWDDNKLADDAMGCIFLLQPKQCILLLSFRVQIISLYVISRSILMCEILRSFLDSEEMQRSCVDVSFCSLNTLTQKRQRNSGFTGLLSSQLQTRCSHGD